METTTETATAAQQADRPASAACGAGAPSSPSPRPPSLYRLAKSVNIIDLALRYSREPKLYRSGNSTFCRCVCGRSEDRTPSVSLSAAKNVFYCFSAGCQRGGSPIDLVMLACHLTDPRDAIRVIQSDHADLLRAAAAGANLPAAEIAQRHAETTDKDARRDLSNLAALLHKDLWDTPEALDYLRRRKIADETLAQFKIGVVKSRQQFLRRAAECGLSPQRLTALGLLTNGNPVLNQRVVFPIVQNDSVVYMIGRTYRPHDDKTPKYLGLRVTPLVAKSPMVFGTPSEGTFVVEGPVDALALYQAGFHRAWQVVALLGLAYERTLRAMKDALGEKVYLALDQDSSGLAMTAAVLGLLAEMGKTGHVILARGSAIESPHTYVPVHIDAKFKDLGDLMQEGKLPLLSKAVIREQNNAFLSPLGAAIQARWRALGIR